MKKKTILVTGGAGYIGSITVKELLDNDFEVVVFDNLETGHKEAIDPRAKLVIGGLANKSEIEAVFRNNKIDGVIDFAAYIAVGESMENPKKYLQNNVFNFINLLDVLLLYGKPPLIKSSTAAVYGNPEDPASFPLLESYTEKNIFDKSSLLGGFWEEKETCGEEFFQKVIDYYQEMISDRPALSLKDDEIAKLRIPASVYGLSKLLDEILMKKYDSNFGQKSVALRYFNVAGADPEGKRGQASPTPTHLITLTIFQALGRIPQLSVFGGDYPTKDGTGVRDYIHIVDLAQGHLAALNYLFESNASDTINLGCGHGYSVLEVIREVERVAGKKVDYAIKERRLGDPAEIYADPTKAGQILHWKAEKSLSDMVRDAYNWHRTHPRGYNSI